MASRRLGRYLRRISRQHQLDSHIILHYDATSEDLSNWFWPVNDAGERVTPSDLPAFRLSHEFRAPCCLCACRDIGGGYTESALYIAEDGPNFGKYMAGCASGRCGYLVCIENMYTKIGLLLHKYPIRSAEGPAPSPILFLPRNVMSRVGAISRPSRRVCNIRRTYASMPLLERPTKSPQTVVDKLLKLDSWGRPGLQEAEFKKLFAQCVCGLVMTRRVFNDHDCAITIVDLTSDNDDSTSVIDLTAEA